MKHLPFYLRETAANFFKGGILTLAGVLSISISMLVIGIILMFYVNLVSIYDSLKSEIIMEVYLEDAVIKEGRVDEIGEHLKKLPGVKNAEYISKEAATEEFVSIFPSEDELLAEADSNPLPASFRLRLDKEYESPSKIAALAEDVFLISGVDDVDYGREWINALANVVRVVQIAGLITVIILGSASILVIVSTIGVSVYARRSQISIMKLVGATDSFVRTPFIFEGIMQGFVGTLIALTILFVAYFAATSVGVALEFFPVLFLIAFISVGPILGVFGSLIAVSRFLRNT